MSSEAALNDAMVLYIVPLRIIAQELADLIKSMRQASCSQPLRVYVCIGEPIDGAPFGDLDSHDVSSGGSDAGVTISSAEIVFATPEMLFGSSAESLELQRRVHSTACRLLVADEVRSRAVIVVFHTQMILCVLRVI